MNKTAVSILQEMAVSRKHPTPEYNFNEKYDVAYNKCFECTVRIGNRVSKGIGASKQDAKHDSARNMLKELYYYDGASQKKDTGQACSTFINYVGRLNEFAAAKKLPYATYVLNGVTATGDFIIKCTFNGHETFGNATTKKQAKQNAAHHMMSSDHIKKIDQYSYLCDTNPVVLDKRVDDTEEELKEIYKKYQNLSITSKENACVKSEPKDLKPVPKGEREILIEHIENSTELKHLEEMCKDRGLDYDIETVAEKKSVLLVLKEKNSKVTVLEQGETYDEALLNCVKRLLIIFITINS